MLERKLLDEAARVLAMPVPRRKAFKHLAAGFAGALLSFLWPKRATATDYARPVKLSADHAPTVAAGASM